MCSNEIAASTAQLVVASKVKADRRSKKLTLLSEASKGVTQSTGKVVGSAREGSQIIEEQGTLLYTTCIYDDKLLHLIFFTSYAVICSTVRS